MVTAEHEALHQIFQHDSDLFARAVMRILGKRLPSATTIRILNADLTESRPLIRKADSVMLAELIAEGPSGRYIVIVESQTDPDEEKSWTWPHYIAHLRDKYRCEVVLLVVCSKAITANWARSPIVCGIPGLACMWVVPEVFGPDNVPVVTSVADARADMGFAVFSALTHSRSARVRGILEVLAQAISGVEMENGMFLAEFVEAGLGDTGAKEIWREMMTTYAYPHVSSFRAEGREQGREEGREKGREEGRMLARTQDILRILDRRGVEIAAADRMLIETCADMATLDVWFDRALVIWNIKDLFVA